MSSPLISVIIPVYNASATIRRCINSLVSQEADIEIICIDDGSGDDSYDVLVSLSKANSSMVVMHHDNSGAGMARNKGLDMARGEYIMFCDADDAYTPNTIDIIVEDIKHFSPDYIVFHRKTFLTDGRVQLWGTGENAGIIPCDWIGYLNDYMNERGHGGGVVTKVFKKSIIDRHHLRFRDYRFGEDICFVVNYIMHAKSLFQEYRAYYEHFQTSGSICLSKYNDFFDLNMIWVRDLIKEHTAEVNQIRLFLSRHIYGVLTWSLHRVLSGVDAGTIKEKKRKCLDLFSKDEVQYFIPVLIHSGKASNIQVRNCKFILNHQFYKYLFMCYWAPLVKGRIITSLHRW